MCRLSRILERRSLQHVRVLRLANNRRGATPAWAAQWLRAAVGAPPPIHLSCVASGALARVAGPGWRRCRQRLPRCHVLSC